MVLRCHVWEASRLNANLHRIYIKSQEFVQKRVDRRSLQLYGSVAGFQRCRGTRLAPRGEFWLTGSTYPHIRLSQSCVLYIFPF
jgi:hypothetical protein